MAYDPDAQQKKRYGIRDRKDCFGSDCWRRNTVSLRLYDGRN